MLQKHDRIAEELSDSGLVPADMNVRPIDNTERAATNTSASVEGYTIPYYNMYGASVPHYRVKLFDQDPKYKQPKDTHNYVYFPRGFMEVAKKVEYVMVTEGEKKAALAVKLGFPCCAFGGVDSWRNRIISFTSDADLSNQGNIVSAKLPAGAELTEDMMSPLAMGMQDLIDYCLMHKKHLIIVYDTDFIGGVKPQVQRAAATLGFELRCRGIPFVKIRQLVLPFFVEGEKVGLDDYLVRAGADTFKKLVYETLTKRSAFPRHPSIRDYIAKRLQKAKMSRKEVQAVSMAVLAELDSEGMRIRSEQGNQTYYFDFVSRKLMKVTFGTDAEEASASLFQQFMYRKFGLSTADVRIFQWLAAQFTGEDPIEDVTPYRVLARPAIDANKIIYQISDSQYVVLTSSNEESIPYTPGFNIFDNGEGGILFEAGHVKELDAKELTLAYREQVKEGKDRQAVQCWWAEVLQQVRLKDKDRSRMLAAMMFYISPWLYRWKGTQLPMEIVLGEAGSGKSTLCELRLNILSGIATLRNAPQDIRDWQASVANTGGLHVTDNVQLTDKSMRQRLSDELCRVITEPAPAIEMRKLYSNAELMKIPISCVFGITAISQPFMNSDILQRSIVLELDKSIDFLAGNLRYDADWMNHQLNRYGGREAWVAHHLYVLHKFFQLVERKWQRKYPARHRLINLEQALVLMSEVFGIDGSWIPDHLSGTTERQVVAADWTFEGLTAFSEYWFQNYGTTKFQASEIAEWAATQEEFMQCEQLTSARKLGRYMTTHKSQLMSICGIQPQAIIGNRQTYFVKQVKR